MSSQVSSIEDKPLNKSAHVLCERDSRACMYGLCVSIHHDKGTLGRRNCKTQVAGGASTLRRFHSRYKNANFYGRMFNGIDICQIFIS